jgi:hypothetical protein
MSDDARAKRSRALLAEKFPALAAQFAQQRSAASAAVIAAGEAVDIRIGDQSLYGGDARGFAAAQVEAFLDKPLRLYMSSPDSAGLVSPVCIRLVKAMQEHLARDHGGEIALYPVGSPSFLVVFGLGLGHHLEALARRTEARWLILVEPIADFFEHSLHTVDWPALFETFAQRGGSVQVITELDPSSVVGAITRFMAQKGIAFTDGSWVFTHYPHWAFAEVRRRLHEALEFAFINRGFFEDELRMMGNAVANFGHRSFALLEGRPRLRRPETAVLVGAGPSLDEGIDTIKRIRDRVVLFSCGTALRPLLRAGIVPDFQCELENVPEVVTAITEAGRLGDLSQIALIASATVDPRVPPLFRETIFYLRDSVSSTEILGRKHRLIPGTSPTCVNMGMAMAAYMGFADFVLFGTDCGVRPGANRHAEGTIYRDLGVWREKDEQKTGSLEVEGNFGGTVHTDWIYDACRLMLAGAIAHYRFNVTNCSDGALIPGARPCVPAALAVTTPRVDRAGFATDLRQSMPRFAPGEFLRATDLDAVRAGAKRLFAEVEHVLAEFGDRDRSFAAVYERIVALAATFGDRYAHADSLIDGALRALPRIGMFYGFRVADPAARDRLFGMFIAEFRAIVAEMAARSDELFAEIATTAGPVSGLRPASGA